MELDTKILDCHVHYSLPVNPEDLISILDDSKTDMANLVIVPHRQRISSVPDALMVKYMHPGRIYVFGSLDVPQYFIHNNTIGKEFVKYVKRMRQCGCDGIKMIEGKPDMRRTLPIPDFDLPSWEPFWKYAEETGLPILWHVNDPEEFWDEAKIPSFAKKKGWFYGPDTINNEVQYTQVFNVLKRHPMIKIIFAHFFFLSAQLERLGQCFEEFPNTCVDLTPGIEMYINFSANRKNTLEFFEKYQNRILYGTDIGARALLGGPGSVLNKAESSNRANLVRSFLSDQGEYTIQSDGDFLIGMDDFQLRALHLRPEIIRKICLENFLRLVGDQPRPVEPKMVIHECRRIKTMMRIMTLMKRLPVADYASVEQVLIFFRNKRKQK